MVSSKNGAVRVSRSAPTLTCLKSAALIHLRSSLNMCVQD